VGHKFVYLCSDGSKAFADTNITAKVVASADTIYQAAADEYAGF
jgi:hypothetical protein